MIQRRIAYPLDQLYIDQDPDWVVDTVPAMLAWLPGTRETARQPVRIDLDYVSSMGRAFRAHRLDAPVER